MLPTPNRPITLLGWLIVALMAIGLAALVYFQPVVLVFFAVMIVIAYLASIPTSRRLERLAKDRASDSICTFVRQFDYRKSDTWILRAVYEELTSYVGFPVHADDDLTKQLNIDHEDLDDTVHDIASRAGRSMAGSSDNPYLNHVHTVADLVAFLTHQPKKDAA